MTEVQNEVNFVVFLVNTCESARRPEPADNVILAEYGIGGIVPYFRLPVLAAELPK
jgi:hypothetical protein